MKSSLCFSTTGAGKAPSKRGKSHTQRQHRSCKTSCCSSLSCAFFWARDYTVGGGEQGWWTVDNSRAKYMTHHVTIIYCWWKNPAPMMMPEMLRLDQYQNSVSGITSGARFFHPTVFPILWQHFQLTPRTTHTNVLGFDGITWTHKPLEILLGHGRATKFLLIFKIWMG